MKIQKNSYFKMKNLKGYFVLPVVFIGVSLLSSSANAITFDNVNNSGSLSFIADELTGTGIKYDTIVGTTGLTLEDVFLSFNATSTGQNAYGAYLFENGGTLEMTGTISNGTNSFTGTIFTGTFSNQTTLTTNVWDTGSFGILTQFVLASSDSTVIVSDSVLSAFGLNPGAYSLTTTAISAYDPSGNTASVSESDLVLNSINVPSTGHTLTMLGFGLMSLNVIVRRRDK